MNSTWGVYEVRGRRPDGTETHPTDKAAAKYFVRWRVNGQKRRRTFKNKAEAKLWQETLTTAKNRGWEADAKGWPIDPSTSRERPPEEVAEQKTPWTFETYIEQTWWPTVGARLEDKSRLGHRRNADLAVQLLRLKQGDPRTSAAGLSAGESIPLHLWTADDTKAALVARRSINGRTAAVNRRRIDAAMAKGSGVTDVDVIPEKAGDATVRAFKITLGMIASAAADSGHLVGDPMAGSAVYAPKPRASRRSGRWVPTLDELFDVAAAISELGPLMPDGRPQGARFRALILVAGTTGPRPGELAAHRPEWIDWQLEPTEIRFRKTEAAVYGAILAPDEKGLRERGLKHREDGDSRSVPLISDVRAALLEHIERGYASSRRTWHSPTGRGHIDFGNLMDKFWRPAFERVFAGTDKACLATCSAGILRKTAITWWADSGITETQAAEWTGHSEEVARIYYASRASTTFAREVELLENQRHRKNMNTGAGTILRSSEQAV